MCVRVDEYRCEVKFLSVRVDVPAHSTSLIHQIHLAEVSCQSFVESIVGSMHQIVSQKLRDLPRGMEGKRERDAPMGDGERAAKAMRTDGDDVASPAAAEESANQEGASEASVDGQKPMEILVDAGEDADAADTRPASSTRVRTPTSKPSPRVRVPGSK